MRPNCEKSHLRPDSNWRQTEHASVRPAIWQLNYEATPGAREFHSCWLDCPTTHRINVGVQVNDIPSQATVQDGVAITTDVSSLDQDEPVYPFNITTFNVMLHHVRVLQDHGRITVESVLQAGQTIQDDFVLVSKGEMLTLPRKGPFIVVIRVQCGRLYQRRSYRIRSAERGISRPRADNAQLGFSAQKTNWRQARGRNTLTVGTWNVRTLLDRCSATERPERRTALIAMELRRYGIDVAALSETRLADQGKLREAGAGYTFYWIGYPTDGVREHGVCFAVADRINGLMIGEPHGISPRMLSMRLRLGRGKCATFVSVYGPTMCHTDDTKDQFYDQLSATIRSAPVNDRLFVLGDLNARVGRDSVAWPGVLGPYGIGSVNANGDRLLHLCATHELAITNTRFQLDASDITTWTHPRSGHHHLLDYVIVRQRDIGEVRITRVMRGAECSTDHRLVRTKLFIHVRKSVYCRSFGQRQKLDIRRLENSETKAAFQRAVVARLHNSPVSTTLEGMWQQLKKQIMVAATETIGVERKKRPDWFDDNNVAISNLVREKNAAFARCTMEPGNGAKKTRFRNIRRQLAERVRGIKDNWWRKQGERIQLNQCAAELLQRAFYVDDCLMSVSTAKDAQAAAVVLKSTLFESGFRFTKFCSNVGEALTCLPIENVSSVAVDLNRQQTEAQKTLGAVRGWSK
ncbi:uncharacterized protein DEA37_0005725 [Paragonimus westermani]|uniref:Endonuclease/exonuclease/phosphatase domain-containing protein n=1 Tax=Paragonimus westermani TaxID=34504 RepID=A0A5J4N6G4_9TREM|nr:uncharacterized protein DEA37_0005725 [Paragonimus westermani]